MYGGEPVVGISHLHQREQLILIVEDDDAVASMIADYLDSVGYRTARAIDGRDAIGVVREQRPDLIVMDLMMPRLTGGEAARLLRDDPLTTRIPIVAISAVADVTSIADLLPIDEILPKPFDLDELAAIVSRLLESQSAPDMDASAGTPA